MEGVFLVRGQVWRGVSTGNQYEGHGHDHGHDGEKRSISGPASGYSSAEGMCRQREENRFPGVRPQAPEEVTQPHSLNPEQSAGR